MTFVTKMQLLREVDRLSLHGWLADYHRETWPSQGSVEDQERASDLEWQALRRKTRSERGRVDACTP